MQLQERDRVYVKHVVPNGRCPSEDDFEVRKEELEFDPAKETLIKVLAISADPCESS